MLIIANNIITESRKERLKKVKLGENKLVVYNFLYNHIIPILKSIHVSLL